MTNKTQSNDEMVQAAWDFWDAYWPRHRGQMVSIGDCLVAFAATQTEPLRKELQYALDDLSMFDNACPYCADSDIGPPLRCSEHSEPEWHHFLDPGDGLPSPCKNGHLFEAVFQEAAEPLKAEVERLRAALQTIADEGEFEADESHDWLVEHFHNRLVRLAKAALAERREQTEQSDGGE